MWDAADFHRLVSGQRHGPAATLLRAGLRAAEVPYSAAISLRNRRYDRGSREIQRVGVPVVSVGNLTVGGTGKTPLVAWLARWFRAHARRVTLISRGYKAEAGAKNDEMLELERQLVDVPHLQNPDRVAAALTAIEEFEAEVLLLDDAFQHRRLHRDLDLVLLDALEPFGYRHLLPRGLLRESLSGLRRADVVALSRADLIDGPARTAIWNEVRPYLADAATAEICHRPRQLTNWSQQGMAIAERRGARVAAFCGIGNPDGFRRTLHSCQLEPIAFRAFPDHHNFNRQEIDHLAEWARAEDADMLLCTGKDLVKLKADTLGDLPLWSLEIGIEFLSGQASLEQKLQEILAS